MGISSLGSFVPRARGSGNIFGPGRTPFEIRTPKVFLIYPKGISPAREKSLFLSAGLRILTGRAFKRTCHMLKNRIELFRFSSHTPEESTGAGAISPRPEAEI